MTPSILGPALRRALPLVAIPATLLSTPLPFVASLPELPLFGIASAEASPNHAHWHYMIGGRASAARNFCKQLHHEASAPGDVSWELARVNASDIERLATEIGTWLDALEEVSSEEEWQAIEPHLAAMTAETRVVTAVSRELLARLPAEDPAGRRTDPAGAPGDAETRSEVALQARTLFHGFGRILAAHKAAEEALAIPMPADPPPLD